MIMSVIMASSLTNLNRLFDRLYWQQTAGHPVLLHTCGIQKG